jgi:hypothetical protein
LLDIVEQKVESLARIIVKGKFHIGLDAVKRYVLFWCMTNYIQEQEENQEMSIFQYAQSVNPLKLKDNKDLYLDDKVKEWNKFYERKVDHYNTLNAENKVKLLIRQKQEWHDQMKQKEEKGKGKERRFEGLSLFPFQRNEFAVLDGIKEMRKPFNELNRTYKRIVSDKGYLSKMTFAQYKDFVSHLKDEINQSQDLLKNIQYYKLEKRLGFEAMKAVLKSLHDCRKTNHVTAEIAVRDLTTVLQLPFLSERQRYAEVYPELSEQGRVRWRLELQGIQAFVQRCILMVRSKLAESKGAILHPKDWEHFQGLYLPETYENDYKLRKDFRAEEFSLLMTELDKQNRQTFERIKTYIEKSEFPDQPRV